VQSSTPITLFLLYDISVLHAILINIYIYRSSSSLSVFFSGLFPLTFFRPLRPPPLLSPFFPLPAIPFNFASDQQILDKTLTSRSTKRITSNTSYQETKQDGRIKRKILAKIRINQSKKFTKAELKSRKAPKFKLNNYSKTSFIQQRKRTHRIYIEKQIAYIVNH